MDPETNENIENIEETDDNQGGEGNTPNEPDYKALYEAAQEEAKQAKAQSRKWEKRAKANPDDQVAELRAELDALKSAQKRAGIVNSVASELNVPRDVLDRMAGDDEETIRANASLLTGLVTAQQQQRGNVPDGGEAKPPTVTREQIEAIEDPMERIHAIAAHRSLFE